MSSNYAPYNKSEFKTNGEMLYNDVAFTLA
jgi:hypothetical protein